MLLVGVKNLRNLQNCLTTNKLSYEFPYSSFELDMDLGFILLSEGKAILTVRRASSFPTYFP